jgi:hypothetical protein
LRASRLEDDIQFLWCAGVDSVTVVLLALLGTYDEKDT